MTYHHKRSLIVSEACTLLRTINETPGCVKSHSHDLTQGTFLRLYALFTGQTRLAINWYRSCGEGAGASFATVALAGADRASTSACVGRPLHDRSFDSCHAGSVMMSTRARCSRR